MNTPETQPSIELTAERERDDNPYAEATEFILDSVSNFNDKQLIRLIDNNLLSIVVDKAHNGDFVPKNPDGTIDTTAHAKGTPDEVISQLWFAATARAVQNPNWLNLIPGNDDNLKKTIARIYANPKLAVQYPYALKERANVLYEQKRKREAEQGDVTPEIYELAGAVEHLGEEAVEHTVEEPRALIDGVPDWATYRDTHPVAEVEDDSPYAPPSKFNKSEFEALAEPAVRVGDKFKILVQVKDTSTGEIVPGALKPELLVVDGFEDEEGEYKARVIVDSTRQVKLISPDKLLTEDSAERVFREEFSAVRPGEKDRIIESLKAGLQEYAPIDGKVYIESGSDGRLIEGQFMGFYNEGDAHLSYQKPLQYAGVKPFNGGAVVGVDATQVLAVRQDAYRSRIFKKPAGSQG